MSSLSSSSSAVLVCPASQSVFASGERGPLWRVVSGEIRIDRVIGHTRQLVQVALAGDLVGIEALCDQAYRYSATALTPARLASVRFDSDAERDTLLRQALMQQQTRCQDMAALRTGPVPQRLVHLLQLLGHAWRQAQGDDAEARALSDHIREALPALREVAQVVDAKHETVCRALARLLPPRSRKPGPPATQTPALRWFASANDASAQAWQAAAA